MEIQYYYPDIIPLKRAERIVLKHNDIVYDEFGRCRKKIVIKDHSYYIDICESVLVDGELLVNLSVPLQLDLFWKLSRNKLSDIKK